MLNEHVVQDSLKYLQSEGATRSLEFDAYWPKWNSPWWHMALLYEMGHAKLIPKEVAVDLAASMRRGLLPVFLEDEVPAGADPVRNIPCPCQMGNIYQILSATGMNVDQEVPWIRPWLLKYQMPDGGLSCDDTAYKASPQASSIVGTIAPLEAILYFTDRAYTEEEIKYLDRGAHCLLERRLMRGCSADHNAIEREDEADWLKLCFPRLYLYDVLRGLTFIFRWAEMRNQIIPLASVDEVITHLETKFPDGQVRIERHSFEGKTTRVRSASGEWLRQQPTTHFPLLDQVSCIGDFSPYLSYQWDQAKQLRDKLFNKGLLV